MNYHGFGRIGIKFPASHDAVQAAATFASCARNNCMMVVMRIYYIVFDIVANKYCQFFKPNIEKNSIQYQCLIKIKFSHLIDAKNALIYLIFHTYMHATEHTAQS